VTLLQYRKARPRLVEICRRHGIPYRAGNVFARFARTVLLFMGLEHQRTIDTRRLIEAGARP
jgi:hypothetical protein